DGKVTTAAARYLRHGDPDAGFVYLGVVDETAHAVGSATPDYLDAIHRTDTRIGRLLAAIRARKTYRQERWMVIVTTDHGQQDLNYGSIVSHGGGSDLERTSFLTAAGFGVKHDPVSVDPRVVDIAPTVLTRLGIPYSGLDGHPLARRAAIPRPIVVRKRHRVVVRAPMGSPNLRRVLIQPASRRRRVTRAPRRFVVRFAGRKALQGVVVIDADGRRTVT
ncbi:MAG: hypothetical protein QOF76_3112, partial [Solirubrobacteraceae bacterium]|nr:hypothetical protein [Solirubrobacteraceae bacterium]